MHLDTHRLLQRVIDECSPESRDLFRVEGAELVAEAARGVDIRTLRDAAGPSRPFDVAVAREVLEFVSIIWGTVKLFRELSASRQRDQRNLDLETRWRAALIEGGVSVAKADEIVTKFAAELTGPDGNDT